MYRLSDRRTPSMEPGGSPHPYVLIFTVTSHRDECERICISVAIHLRLLHRAYRRENDRIIWAPITASSVIMNPLSSQTASIKTLISRRLNLDLPVWHVPIRCNCDRLHVRTRQLSAWFSSRNSTVYDNDKGCLCAITEQKIHQCTLWYWAQCISRLHSV
jgi:hypothetical protein